MSITQIRLGAANGLVALALWLASGRASAGSYGADEALEAIAAGNNVALEQMIKAGLEVNATGGRFRESLLSNAILLGKPKAAAMLIAAGADINTPTGIDGAELSPLDRAANVCDLETAKLLLARGADVNGRSGGELSTTPLLLSLSQTFIKHGDCFAVFSLLLEHGADVNAARGSFGGKPGHNAVMLATYVLDSRYMIALLERGASPNSSSFETTALESAIEQFPIISNFDRKRDEKLAREALDVIRALVNAGANLDVRGKDGQSLVELVRKRFATIVRTPSLIDPSQTIVLDEGLRPAKGKSKARETERFYRSCEQEILRLLTPKPDRRPAKR
jgi:ankyrin repeat protein